MSVRITMSVEQGVFMANTERFVIDPKASRFSVKAVASGMTAGLGHNPTISIRDFEGEAQFVPETLDAASLTVTVRAASLSVEDEMAASDRQALERIMHQQVLATSRHPEVYYKSAAAKVTKLGEGLFRLELSGQLTLNGITRMQPVGCQVTIGAYNLRATGNFELRQSDFGIKPTNIAGGMLTIRDELKFAFFIVARQPEPASISTGQGSDIRTRS
jgi:polyisoprenoid-binding protein YceI